MKLFFTLLLVAIISTANAQTIKDHQVVIGKTDSVASKILNEKRTVWIYLPTGYDPAAKQRYPVVYLLDADWNFAAFSGMEHELSEVIGNTVFPPMIVVAIPNTDRTRDLTPTNGNVDPDGKKTDDFKTSGGGEKFTAFIQKELMPHIDSAYQTVPYKMLIGHSFGGLTAMNIIINHTDMFNSYIVIDPSMWWDSRKLLNQARDVFKQKKFEGKSMFLAIANTMPSGMDTLRVQKDTSGTSGHIKSILQLKNILQQNPGNGLNWSYKYYNTDSHGSVPLIAEYDGMHFLFSFYNFPPGFEATMIDKNAKIDVESLISSHYDDVSKHMGYKILPPEDMLNQVGYYLLGIGMPERAYAVFNLNIKNYPDSFNAYDSMGDYYDNQKNKAKAIEYYTKSLKIKETPDTRKKLDKLQASK
ncbi:alpha/beta hydrolase-fold protein [Mucilaginibacter sp. McL0603]|uniref:alpha/beta hydrolase-fold protein n=1 Tax=Mucilaginibacter sp. McL0603 TaxID=3415670 RepID=UPI003CED4552